MALESTPSQTVGPYFSIGLPWDGGPDAVAPDDAGALTIGGVVYDGAGTAIPDAMIETWQADASGAWGTRDGFRGFARVGTDDDGRWAIRTVKPGAAEGAAPFIEVSVFARGLLHRCVTRIYFGDEEAANREDAVLASVPAERRDTLLATPTDDGYRFDIHLQGDGETVFFDV
ncbi:protocatechuate 3,4-dioxygenase subunit alpha [Conexibacter woesei]|uniref:protocatechuate 3,4-dioxygenase subunit alpha n=1 Tax=Conexibacter woesei TaxID=191495 RepID=UPI0003FC11CB|nr:protocatechuate 3,4-dioxygenase subunit alpha [Conexibacter woesei]